MARDMPTAQVMTLRHLFIHTSNQGAGLGLTSFVTLALLAIGGAAVLRLFSYSVSEPAYGGVCR